MNKPSIGRIVHYVSHGTPGGEYGKECRAAVVTEVGADGSVGLAVLNPTGFFFHRGSPHHEAPDSGVSACPGGTWHWPERT